MFSVATVLRVNLYFPDQGPQLRGRTRLTAFDISRLVNDTSSGTASTNINTDIVIHVWVQVIVRAVHCQFDGA